MKKQAVWVMIGISVLWALGTGLALAEEAKSYSCGTKLLFRDIAVRLMM